MPTDVIYVDRVDMTPTVRPDVQRYLVTGCHVDDRPGGFQAYTLNALRAALCERAGLADQAVVVTWKHSRYGRDIVDVTLFEVEADDPGDPDGEVFRGNEAAAYAWEQQHEARKLK